MSIQSNLHIDSTHCRAICDEIGERLRAMLSRQSPALPLHLQLLMDRLVEQDQQASPSIAPAMDDMVWQKADPIELHHAA
jgi:hypothetical protein